MKTSHNIWQRFSDGIDMFMSIIESARGDPDAWETSIKKLEAQGWYHRP